MKAIDRRARREQRAAIEGKGALVQPAYDKRAAQTTARLMARIKSTRLELVLVVELVIAALIARMITAEAGVHPIRASNYPS